MMVPIGYNVHATKRIDPSTVTCRSVGNAEPTSAVMEFPGDQLWQQPATLPTGEPCNVMYHFGADEIEAAEHNDEHYPWDDDHVALIELLG